MAGKNGFHELRDELLEKKDGIAVVELANGAAILAVSQERPIAADTQANTISLDSKLTEKIVRVFDLAASTNKPYVRISFIPNHNRRTLAEESPFIQPAKITVQVSTVPPRAIEVTAKTFPEDDPLIRLAKDILAQLKEAKMLPQSEVPLMERLKF